MRSRMEPSWYTDERWFRLEEARLFGRLWQFFTLKMLVAAPDAFVVRTLGGRSIVLQNMAGTLRAFDNVCLHRQAPLQDQPEGVRPLVCPYHAWRYDAEGRPSIPQHDELYRFDAAERAALRLRSYPVEVVGNLVFISLAERPLPIEEQLAPAFLDALRACSSRFDDEVMVTTLRGRFNWKLAYENLRDVNHPRFIHARSLARAFTFAPDVDEGRVRHARALHASDAPLGRDAALAELRDFSWGGLDAPATTEPLPWHARVERLGDADGYLNWLVFPNLHVASPSGGRSFTIEHHVPVAPDRTDVIVHWVTATKRAPYDESTAVLYAHMVAGEPVLTEDLEVLAGVQASLARGAPRAHLGDYEHMNLRVERWYAAVMDGALER